MSRTGSNYPNGFRQGVSIYNTPLEVAPLGKVWWVDVNAATNGYGLRQAPYASVSDAITAASAGDTIMLEAGHTEALTATSFTASKAINIIGRGTGSRIPTFTAAIAAGTVNISAENVSISNVKLIAGFATGCTAAVTVDYDSHYCTLDRITCRDGASNNVEWKLHISLAHSSNVSASNCTIKSCSLIGLIAGSMTNSILVAGTTSNLVIVDNYIDVDSSGSTVHHDAQKGTSVLIARNIILNQDTTATAEECVELEATTTGIVAWNIGSYANAGSSCFLGEAAFLFENYGGNTAGASGELDPAATEAIP